MVRIFEDEDISVVLESEEQTEETARLEVSIYQGRRIIRETSVLSLWDLARVPAMLRDSGFVLTYEGPNWKH